MPTEPALLNDLIRQTWEGQLQWTPNDLGRRSKFRASYAGNDFQITSTYHNYQVSPGGMISEQNFSVARHVFLNLYRELQAPRAWKQELWNAIGFKAWEIDSAQKEILRNQGYLIRCERHGKAIDILYQEAGHYLKVYFEIGTTFFEAGKRALQTWCDPSDSDIKAEKQAEIASRIVTWGELANVPLRFPNFIN
jgi:hypothetical protein